jgi:thiamine-monophosphate kinase
LHTVSSLGERALIQRIAARLTTPAWVIVGVGDDAAVVAPAPRTYDVLTTDALVDGVHFDRSFVPPDAIGHRALAVNLSDLAAMGAEPRAALLSLVLPDSIDVADIDAIVDGVLALAAEHRVALVGGNITRTPGPLVVNMTAFGAVHPRRILTRGGARPGDEVYVTGMLGDAATGLQMLRASRSDRSSRSEGSDRSDGSVGQTASSDPNVSNGPNDSNGPCVERYLRPQPRMRAGLLLSRNRAATSCMDVSDGLADGVRQIAEASSCGITVDAAAVPISPAARAWHEQRGTNPIDMALSGGDDYELVFTVRPSHRGRLRGVRQRLGTLPVTRIGVVTKGRELQVRDGETMRELPAGYEHFR